MKAIPQEIQLALTLASCLSHLLKFEKIYGNFQCIFISNYFTVSFRPLLKRIINVLHTPGGALAKKSAFGSCSLSATVH